MSKITKEQIICCADTFVEKNGRTPTYNELRQALGGGSPVTLNKYYREWRAVKDAELASQAVMPFYETVPIPERVVETLSSAWSLAIAAIKTEHQKEVELMQSVQRAENEKLKADLEERDGIVAALEAETVELQDAHEQAMTQANSKIAALSSQLAATERDAARQAGRVEELEKQVAGTAEALLQERALVDDAHSEVANLRAQLMLAEKEIVRVSDVSCATADN